MQSWRLILAAVLLAAITVLALPYPALAQSGNPPDTSGLSPYWDPAVTRWEDTIIQHAQGRNIDPDLVAAVIWKESLGRPRERGPAGAVGLMMLMPFPWRPSADELENPWTNVFWGTRTLSHIIRDGNGDLYYALAAYNGSWEQIHLSVTRSYAASVLDHYARAVAVRHKLPADGAWIAIFAIEGTHGPNTITVLGPHRPLIRYTERAWIQADIPTAPAGIPPHATAITFVDERGAECRVNVWLAAEDGSPLVSSALQPGSPSHFLAAGTALNVRGETSSLHSWK
ncbi:MAG: transglycosylase SLT domain-containing protein [Chloroflexota bacterium]|nr:transglycosylase SLT domain-containing protein [Chloroflexota bacterium]